MGFPAHDESFSRVHKSLPWCGLTLPVGHVNLFRMVSFECSLELRLFQKCVRNGFAISRRHAENPIPSTVVRRENVSSPLRCPPQLSRYELQQPVSLRTKDSATYLCMAVVVENNRKQSSCVQMFSLPELRIDEECNLL